MEQNLINKIQEILSKLNEGNPELFIEKFDLMNRNLMSTEIEQVVKCLSQSSDDLGKSFNGYTFNNLNKFQNSIKNKPDLTVNDECKLKELGVIAITKELEDKQKWCFVNDSECNNIIRAHSIQENGELSRIADEINSKKQVLHFTRNVKTGNKELTPIDITQASTFHGFCHKHDQIFEPIDKKTFQNESERNFLYSLRAFSQSYHYTKSYQNYFSNITDGISGSLNPIIDTLKEISSTLGLNLVDELENVQPQIINNEQIEILKIQRFESHRESLLEYVKNKSYSNLDYLTYEVNHVCPIVCCSWIVSHVKMDNGFIVSYDGNKPYYGFPILISLLPISEQKSILVLARFKSDLCSALYFNQLHIVKSNNNEKFEKEISRLIFKDIENFYLSPIFWKSLSKEQQDLLSKTVNVGNEDTNEQITFDFINFFDKKHGVAY